MAAVLSGKGSKAKILCKLLGAAKFYQLKALRFKSLNFLIDKRSLWRYDVHS